MFSQNTLEQALWLESEGCSVIPLYPRSKRPCAELLPTIDGTATWKPYQTKRADRAEIQRWFERKADINIGLVCGAISGVVCVDVDGEKGQEWFKSHISTTAKPNLYQFTSSSHKFHAFYKHPGSGVIIPPSVKGINDEIDIRGDGSYCVISPSIHPDTGKPYLLKALDSFTGMSSLVPCPDVQLTKNGDSLTIAETVAIPDGHGLADVPQGERDSTLTGWCARWYSKGLSVDEISLLAHAFNASRCKPPLPQKDVDKIVKSIGRTHAGNHPLAFNTQGLQNWIDLQGVGTFTISQIFSQLGIKHVFDRERVLMGLKDMQDRGIIEQAGKDTSTFRKIVQDATKIDLFTEDESKTLPMWFPFGLTERLQIKPKNVIIVAGESNAGKTAFLFNIMHMNGNLHKFKYITSEMTQDEILSRIEKMGSTKEKYSEFCEFYAKTHDYADAVDPERINIIDFLEMYDDFYRVGAEIKKIFDKLTTGCAFIALQKKRGEIFGRGGEFSIEKARLALSLFTHGRTKDGIVGSCLVTKCKNYIPGRNPEGNEYFYILKRGSYYDNEISGVFSQSAVGLNQKQRMELLLDIDKYCKENQRQAYPQEDIDAYGFVRER